MLKINKTPVPEFVTIRSFVSVIRHRYEDHQYDECFNAGESHDSWEFLHLKNGKLNMVIDGELQCLLPGQSIIYAPFSFHSISSSTDAVIDIVDFNCNSNALSCLSNTPIPLSREQSSALEEIMCLGDECFILPAEPSNEIGAHLRREIPDYALQKLARLVELFLLDLCRHNSAGPGKSVNTKNPPVDEEFAALTTFLINNLHRMLTAEEICAELSIGVSKLGKLCKAQCGCGPIDYFNSLKIGAAKRMISEKRLNLTQISERLGFSSVHYFSRLFKAKTGISPSRYLNKHINNTQA